MQQRTSTHAEPAERLTELVYELLDAHLDTTQLAHTHGLDELCDWRAHLDYLSALQRTGRELLAHTSTEARR
jgi:hypothetical protein